ncbi:MAG: FAD-binding oxidoreductase [Polyangiales bacterium]
MSTKCREPRPTRRAFLALLGAMPAACSFPAALRPRRCLGAPAADGTCRELLWSYNSLQYCRARVLHPRDEGELIAMLRQVADAGHKLTIRGGGASLDTQSLTGDTVVTLDAPAFTDVSIHRAPNGEVRFTAGAGAMWGDVLRALRARGLVPYAAPSASYIRVGGGFAANSFSRMTTRWGREERYIRAFTLITVGGTRLECAPDAAEPRARQVWDAAPGALGYLGVVTSVTYAARPLPGAHAVHTHYTVSELPDDERSASYQAELDAFFNALFEASTVLESATTLGDVPDTAARNDGVYGTIWWTRGLTPRLRTLLAKVRYDPQPPPDAHRGLLNRRDDFVRIYGEYAMTQPGGESSVQNLNFLDARCAPDSWDPIEDFAFFQDADLRAKLEAEPFWRMTSAEQAYCIPKRGQREFLRVIDDTVRLYDHFPTLVDLLYAPKDARATPLPLSATKDGGALVFTLAYLDRNGERWSCTRQVYRTLAAHCARLGGRVYLAKTVEVEPEDMRTMWGDGVRALVDLKLALDPRNVLVNEFWREKLLPAASEA